MSSKIRDLTEVELILREVPVRDKETDEETTEWVVEHPDLERSCRGETPKEALDIFGACTEDSAPEEVAIDLEEIAE